MIRRICGYSLLASPIVAFIALLVHNHGILVMVCIVAGIGLFAGVISLGCKLAFDL